MSVSLVSRTNFAILSVCLMGAVPLASKADSVSDFYAGKTLTIQVGFSAGGGYDTSARILAKHFGNHLSGKPNVVVQNVPGGGSTKLASSLFNTAPKNGLYFRDKPITLAMQRGEVDGACMFYGSSIRGPYKQIHESGDLNLIAQYGEPLLQDPGLTTRSGRAARRDEYMSVVEAWCRQRTREQIYRQAQELRIPIGPVVEPHEMLDDPHFAARQVITETCDSSFGAFRSPALPVRWNEKNENSPCPIKA